MTLSVLQKIMRAKLRYATLQAKVLRGGNFCAMPRSGRVSLLPLAFRLRRPRGAFPYRSVPAQIRAQIAAKEQLEHQTKDCFT